MTPATGRKRVILLTQGLEPYSWSDLPPHLRAGHHYDHAPIIEAIIEVQCELPAGTTLDDLARAVDANEFSPVGAAVAVSGRIDVSEEGVKGSTSGERVGHLFRRGDGLRMIQSRLNGFAYSFLPPYERWETFSAEAWTHWLNYERIAHPTRATRLGVRYVNKIDIPQINIEIKDYLRTAVDVSPYLPQMTSSYFLQIAVPISHFEATATITSTVAPSPSEASSSLILDIDTWRNVDIPLGSAPDGQTIKEQLEVLRDAKNYVFEACITDATRGLIS